MKTGYKVCDAMTANPIKVGPNTSIKDCAKIMADRKVGSLIIEEKGKLLGIIKERDIVRSVVLENKDAERSLVKDYMVKKVITIAPEVDIYEALLVMRDEDVRMLPVMNGDKIMGLLTVKDILKIQPELFEILAEKLILREEDRKPIFSNR
jgi:signal-transduction protein with cAMP-binding, CBS, and nucleotidyltransferase domain